MAGPITSGLAMGLQLRAQREQQAKAQERLDAAQGLSTLSEILKAPKNLRGPLIDFYSKNFGAKYGVDMTTLGDIFKKADDEQATYISKALRGAIGDISADKMDPRQLIELAGNPVEALKLGLSLHKAEQDEATKRETAKIFGSASEPTTIQGTTTAYPRVDLGADSVPTHGDEAAAFAPRQASPIMVERPPMNASEGQSLIERGVDFWRQRAMAFQAIGNEKAAEGAWKNVTLLEARLNRMGDTQTETLDRPGGPRRVMVSKRTGDEVRDLGPLAKDADSTVGKVGDDLARAERMYGKDSPQFKALNQALTAGGEGPKLSDESTMRSQFAGLSKDFVVTRDFYQRLKSAAANPSPAGDIQMIFAFMKMQDAQSTILPGEYATAESARGVSSSIVALYNKLLDGAKLTPAQRKDFLAQAERAFKLKVGAQRNLENQYRAIARRAGIVPENVVLDFIAGEDKPAAAADPTDVLRRELGR